MTEPTSDAESTPPDARSTYGLVLMIMLASTLLGMLAYTGPIGNVVTLTEEFDASRAGTAWILASMSVGLAVTLLAAGVIADRVGHRQVFLGGTLAFAVACALCAVVDSTVLFVLARVVAGLGAAGMIATGLGLVAASDAEGLRRSTTATGWGAALGAGIALGPLFTGLLDLVDLWRAFYGLLALGGVAVWAGARRLRLSTRAPGAPARRFDVIGFVLLTAFLAVAVTAIVAVRANGPGTATALGALATVLLVALVISQRLGTARLIDPGLFGHRPFLGATVAGFGTGVGVISVMSFACTYLVAEVGLSTFEAGGMLAAWSGTSAVAALLLARYTARIAGATQLMIGLLGVALGMALMTGVDSNSGAGHLLPGLLVAGLASGVLNTALARQSVATVPAAAVAMGTGANNTARYLGAAIGVSVATVIATSGGMVAGWNQVAWLGAAASLVCAVIVGLLSVRSPG